jgi:hypothetical protein
MTTKFTKTLLATAVTGALAMATAGTANADVYAGSLLQIQNLTINITPAALSTVNNYSFNLDNSATLNGSTDATAGISSSCDSVLTPCAASPASPLTALAANAPGSAPLRVDGAGNNFTFFGPGSGLTYANSDSEILTAQLVDGVPTSTVQISEAELAGTGTGQSATNVQSNTQFTFTFTLTEPGTFILDFDADPDLFVSVDTLNLFAAIAQANTGASVTLASTGAGVSVQWTPNGTAGGFSSCSGVGVTCIEDNDEESLSNTIGLPPGNPISAGISDNRFAASPDLGWSDFGITVSGLPAGTYALTLNATSSVNVTQRVNAVPEPGFLALMGLGLMGVFASSRRKKLS